MLWIKIKYRLALYYREFLFKIGFEKVLLKNRYGERILVFHGINQTGGTQFNSRFVSKSYFEKFVKYISSHYNVISLDDFYRKKFKKNTLNIALTFDDGYLNNYEIAIPILKKYGIPASFFVTTIHENASFLWPDFLDLVTFHTPKKEVLFDGKYYQKNIKNEFACDGFTLKNRAKTLPYEKILPLYDLFNEDWIKLQEKSLEEYWQLMNIDQIKEVANDELFSVGSHSKTHSNLTKIDIEEAKAEILKSKNFLETICNQTVDEFAFPFGIYSKELVAYCRDLGFKKLLLVDYNKDEDRNDELLKNRFVINPHIPLRHQLVCLLKDSYF